MQDNFQLLELPVISQNMREQIAWSPDSIDTGGFERYLLKRMDEKFPKENFLHILRNTFLHFQDLNKAAVSLIVNKYLTGHHYADYFYYLIKRDYRPEGSILVTTMWHLQYLLRQDALNEVSLIADKTGMDVCLLLMRLMEAYQEAPSIKRALLVDDLDPYTRYGVMCAALRYQSTAVFDTLAENLSDSSFARILKERIRTNGDHDLLMLLLQSGKFNIAPFPMFKQFNQILFDCCDFIPKTIGFLFAKAEKEKCWELIIQMAVCFPKKDVLRVLIRAGDPILVDKFFFLYKNYPDVKNLTPFL